MKNKLLLVLGLFISLISSANIKAAWHHKASLATGITAIGLGVMSIADHKEIKKNGYRGRYGQYLSDLIKNELYIFNKHKHKQKQQHSSALTKIGQGCMIALPLQAAMTSGNGCSLIPHQ